MRLWRPAAQEPPGVLLGDGPPGRDHGHPDSFGAPAAQPEPWVTCVWGMSARELADRIFTQATSPHPECCALPRSPWPPGFRPPPYSARHRRG